MTSPGSEAQVLINDNCHSPSGKKKKERKMHSLVSNAYRGMLGILHVLVNMNFLISQSTHHAVLHTPWTPTIIYPPVPFLSASNLQDQRTFCFCLLINLSLPRGRSLIGLRLYPLHIFQKCCNNLKPLRAAQTTFQGMCGQSLTLETKTVPYKVHRAHCLPALQLCVTSGSAIK